MSLTSDLKKQIFIQAQRIVPQQQLSRVVGKVAASENPLVKNLVIQAFKAKYGIDMSIAEQTDALKYKSFNDFFTRALKDGIRGVILIHCILYVLPMVQFLKLVKYVMAMCFKPKVKVFQLKN